MKVETTKYQGVHGKQPKGVGRWAFINKHGAEYTAPCAMTLTEAKKWLNTHIMPQYGRSIRSSITWQVAP